MNEGNTSIDKISQDIKEFKKLGDEIIFVTYTHWGFD